MDNQKINIESNYLPQASTIPPEFTTYDPKSPQNDQNMDSIPTDELTDLYNSSDPDIQKQHDPETETTI